MAVEGVNCGRFSARESRRHSAERAGLGCVGVNDVRPELPYMSHEGRESVTIVSGAQRSTEASYPRGLDIRGLREQVIGLVVSAPPCEQSLVKLIVRQVTHEARDLNRWSPDIHARNHTHDSQSAHDLSLPGITK